MEFVVAVVVIVVLVVVVLVVVVVVSVVVIAINRTSKPDAGGIYSIHVSVGTLMVFSYGTNF